MTIDELWETITLLDKVIVDLKSRRNILVVKEFTRQEEADEYTQLTSEIHLRADKMYHLSCEVNALLGDKYYLLPNGNVLIVDSEGVVLEKEKL